MSFSHVLFLPHSSIDFLLLFPKLWNVLLSEMPQAWFPAWKDTDKGVSVFSYRIPTRFSGRHVTHVLVNRPVQFLEGSIPGYNICWHMGKEYCRRNRTVSCCSTLLRRYEVRTSYRLQKAAGLIVFISEMNRLILRVSARFNTHEISVKARVIEGFSTSNAC